MKYLGFEFNKIIIIESLPKHEDQIRNGSEISSGEYYTTEFFPYCNTLRDEAIPFELIKVNSKDELLRTLQSINEEIKENGQYPILHFEIHGTENQDSISINNGDFLGWRVLLDVLTEINISTSNNLFVIFATCSGAFNLKYIMPRETAFPYYAALAPDNPDMPILLEERYSLFYLDLLVSGNLENAFRMVTQESRYARIILSTCEYYLYQAFQQEYLKIKDDARVDNLVKIMENRQNGMVDRTELRKLVLAKFSEPDIWERTLTKMKNKFLLGSSPKNSNRFQFNAKDLLNLFSKDNAKDE
jgi:hypothetical protein